MPSPAPNSYRYPKAMRLGGRGTFKAIYSKRMKFTRGPLVVYAQPSETGVAKLGISIGRPVGNAVRRNRIKRLIRESFRLNRAGWPGAYDFVVVVRPHAPLALADYQSMLSEAANRLHSLWSKRTPANPASDAPRADSTPPQP